MKGVNERIKEGVLQLFGHVERMENDNIIKKDYVGRCAGSHSEDRWQKRWIDTVKDYRYYWNYLVEGSTQDSISPWKVSCVRCLAEP